jgi:hypothetical protein
LEYRGCCGNGKPAERKEDEMTKREIVEMLVENLPEGCQARRYWVNRYMRIRKAGLWKLLDLRTDPNAQQDVPWLSLVESIR